MILFLFLLLCNESLAYLISFYCNCYLFIIVFFQSVTHKTTRYKQDTVAWTTSEGHFFSLSPKSKASCERSSHPNNFHLSPCIFSHVMLPLIFTFAN